MKKISRDCFIKTDKILVKKLKIIEPLELSNILQHFFAEKVREHSIQDLSRFLDSLTKVIPLEKIQEAVKENVEDALIEAKSMFEEAKLYLQENQNTSTSIKARLYLILDGLISVIETILTSFGIGDIFEPSESDRHADNKSQKIIMILSCFTAITTMIPILGATISSLVVGGTFLTISALSLIWPLIKPRTKYLPANAENWTRQVQQGVFDIQGRKESIDEIANIMKIGRHAILVGPSRVGKTLTAKAFTQAVERGDYPELSGKVIFCINAAEIIGQKASFLGSGSKILNRISETMGRHRDDIILVIDGIHVACKKKEKIADQLISFLEEGGKFPHVIGITTDVEYDEYVKDNQALALRFDKVDIKSMEEEETLGILYHTLLRSHEKPLVKEEALVHIYNKTFQEGTAPQPEASLKLLKKCINKTKRSQRSPIEQEINEVANKLLSLRSQVILVGNRKKEIGRELSELEMQMDDLQDELKAEKEGLDKLFKSKELLGSVKKELYASILKISTICNILLTTKEEKQLKRYLLLHQFLKQSLESYIDETAKTLGVKMFIDQELIDEVTQYTESN